jgi:uncharacterized protein YlzI (FlbEa/FlbD family)
MSRKHMMALAIASVAFVAPHARAGQMPSQWFLGKWGCTLDATPMTMIGMIGGKKYVFRNMLRGVRVDMHVIIHTPTTVSMQDESGNIFSLRSQIRALGPKMVGRATIDGLASNISCLKSTRLLSPANAKVRVPSVLTQ